MGAVIDLGFVCQLGSRARIGLRCASGEPVTGLRLRRYCGFRGGLGSPAGVMGYADDVERFRPYSGVRGGFGSPAAGLGSVVTVEVPSYFWVPSQAWKPPHQSKLTRSNPRPSGVNTMFPRSAPATVRSSSTLS